MGVILYAILCGCLPFDPSRPEKLPKLIAKGQYVIDESLSKSSRCLISKMLCVDPEERITMSELCKHPWVMEDWGSPIDLLVDNKQVQPLIPNIVKEISLYTRIPQAEMTR
uniref:Protein kinase domain-containing protein n=1 Tax=Mesocestoides corti TaxID=53468 RepID=A0A5K3FKV2_MESCO